MLALSGVGKGGETKVPSGVEERLAAYMKSVKSRSIPVWQQILELDDTKGQAGLHWNDFVKVCHDLTSTDHGLHACNINYRLWLTLGSSTTSRLKGAEFGSTPQIVKIR